MIRTEWWCILKTNRNIYMDVFLISAYFVFFFFNFHFFFVDREEEEEGGYYVV